MCESQLQIHKTSAIKWENRECDQCSKRWSFALLLEAQDACHGGHGAGHLLVPFLVRLEVESNTLCHECEQLQHVVLPAIGLQFLAQTLYEPTSLDGVAIQCMAGHGAKGDKEIGIDGNAIATCGVAVGFDGPWSLFHLFGSSLTGMHYKDLRLARQWTTFIGGEGAPDGVQFLRLICSIYIIVDAMRHNRHQNAIVLFMTIASSIIDFANKFFVLQIPVDAHIKVQPTEDSR